MPSIFISGLIRLVDPENIGIGTLHQNYVSMSIRTDPFPNFIIMAANLNMYRVTTFRPIWQHEK